ncbi:extracellular solute-binding protein [Streptacidiphilus rugosus]|uniref:extracellular solute-binding protein n=1 Tax=Streptacidiphilus rugosus TaxID=405783 RepID=UPI000563011A|nr:extracellular solute-binding protein [Streptacidiphilus rugosus]
MNRRLIAAIGSTAMLFSIAACSSSSTTDKSKPAADPAKITVWLAVDAQQNWPGAVSAATATFTKAHPNTKVDVQYYSWGDKNTKFDAALATPNVPDVIEMGNTETLSYMIKGAFAPLDATKFTGSSDWLPALQSTATYQGKLFGVPYYAGVKTAAWRKDVNAAAGVTNNTPTSWAELTGDLDKVQAKQGSGFSAWYQPTRDWYAAMSFVYDNGGQIAKADGSGKFTATLEDPAAQAGLASWKAIEDKYMHGDKTKDESDRYIVYGQGKSDLIFGAGWEAPSAADPKFDKTGGKLKDNIVPFALPGVKNATMPSFIGGSDLVVPVKSPNVALASEWINDFTNPTAQQALVTAGNLPNNKTMMAALGSDPKLGYMAKVALNTWFVPTAPGWLTVEKNAILQNMLQDIATGKASIADATKNADTQINAVING